MLFRPHWTFLYAASIVLWCASTSAETIDFGSSFVNLPYTEKGLTFTNLPGTSPAVIGTSSGDGHLVAGTNVTPIHVRVSGMQPFRLISLDVEQIFRTWRIESSHGAVTGLPGVGAVGLGSDPDWTNLTYFDLIHDPGEANGSIRVDNIEFSIVPEPAAWALSVALALTPVISRRRLKGGRDLDSSL